MRIRFGMALDRGCGRAAGDRLAAPALGPAGLLELLETQLGLARPWPAPAERLIAGLAALRRCDAPARFWHASFGVDALGTVAELLAWRDLWWLHGWDGRVPADAPARLHDLAAFAAALDPAAHHAAGDRLARIAARLSRRRAAIAELALCTPWAELPARWQQVLVRLPWREELRVPAALDAGSDLGRLQAALAGGAAGAAPAPAAWRGDGSVRLVRAGSRLLAARWLAAERAHFAADTLLVAGAAATLADDAGAAAGGPRLGVVAAGASAPALTLLPLALALLWRPLDCAALLEFLTHPLCPLPAHARRDLARTVAERPGMGGSAWQAALARIAVRAGVRAPAVGAAIADWLAPPAADPGRGAPPALLLATVERVAAVCTARLAQPEAAVRSAAAAGLAQAQGLARALLALAAVDPAAVLRPRALARLLASVDPGSPDPCAAPGAGAPVCIEAPAAAIDAWPAVVWWQPQAPALPPPWPWPAAERAALAAAGVQLPTQAARLAAHARDELRPVLAARERLTLVLPPPETDAHPLGATLAALFPDAPVAVLETTGAAAVGSVAPQPVAHRPLPAPQRWWRLPAGSVPDDPDRGHSYTSLAELIDAPHAWVLRRVARLEAGVLPQLADGGRLYGLLAHRLVEDWFRAPDALAQPPAALDAWFAAAFPALIATEGASLLAPGCATALAGFRRRAQRALGALHAALRAGGAVAAVPERALTGRFAGGRLSGTPDLAVRDAAGRPGLIDLKWSVAARLRERLERGRHLQLAVYAELLRQHTGRPVGVAYAALPEARLLAPDAGVCAAAWTVPPANGEDVAALWARAVAAYAWRRAQLDAGQIEVTSAGTPLADAASPPPAAYAPQPLPPACDPYRTLAFAFAGDGDARDDG